MVAETNALVRDIADSAAAHEPSKSVEGRKAFGGFDSRPPPLKVFLLGPYQGAQVLSNASTWTSQRQVSETESASEHAPGRAPVPQRPSLARRARHLIRASTTGSEAGYPVSYSHVPGRWLVVNFPDFFSPLSNHTIMKHIRESM